MATTQTAARRGAPTTITSVLVGIAVACAAVFAVLAIVVWHVHGPVSLDHTLGYTKPSYGHIWRRLMYLGSPWFVFTALLVVAALAFMLEDYVALAVCIVGPLLAGLVELLGKPTVHRIIGHSLSYPSGHVTLATSLAAVLVFVAYRLGGVPATVIAAVPAVALALLTSIAVVQVGAHYPTDAIGGLSVGLGVVAATAAAVGQIVKNRSN
jgi:undecaprenyl-diphosphatase